MDDIINNGEFGEEEFRDMNKIDDENDLQSFEDFTNFYGFVDPENNNDEDLKELNF